MFTVLTYDSVTDSCSGGRAKQKLHTYPDSPSLFVWVCIARVSVCVSPGTRCDTAQMQRSEDDFQESAPAFLLAGVGVGCLFLLYVVYPGLAVSQASRQLSYLPLPPSSWKGCCGYGCVPPPCSCLESHLSLKAWAASVFQGQAPWPLSFSFVFVCLLR